jgi:hypothetical protein
VVLGVRVVELDIQHFPVALEIRPTQLHHRGTMEVILPVLEHLHMLLEAEEALVV